MDRQTLQYVALALVGVLAVAFAAATFPETVQPDAGQGGFGGDEGGGGSFLPPPPEEAPGSVIEIPLLEELLVVLAVVAVVLGLAYLLENWREVLAVLVAVAVVLGLVFLLLQILEPGTLPPGPGQNQPAGGVPGFGGDGSETAISPSLPTLLVVVLLGLALVVAVGVLLRRRPDDGGERAPGAGAGGEAGAVGRAAGRAADRLAATGDLDNEVYRAWREMTALLDVPRPETKAPGEFAAAAVEAGMGPDDVEELTGLFERVRYGGREPTAVDERRAIDVLRRIEEAYAPEDRDPHDLEDGGQHSLEDAEPHAPDDPPGGRDGNPHDQKDGNPHDQKDGNPHAPAGENPSAPEDR